MQIGKFAAWAATESMTAAQVAAFAARVEQWGYSALWLPEGMGRNVLVHSSWLLANTKKLIVATGIANLYARDPMAMAGAQQCLAEQSGDRFLLGIGVSHAPLVEGVRRLSYGKPIETMRAYLTAMKQAEFYAPKPPLPPKTIIAALGWRMLEVAGELADGAHPYNVTPDHTAKARQILGPDKWLCPEQKVILETDPAKARAIARDALRVYCGLPNYLNSWKRLGFTDEDVSGDLSDRLVDAITVWGDESTIRKRLQEHLDAGADQVCVNAVLPDQASRSVPNEALLAMLSPNGGRR
jgi:probable F420-dependent oxidoreductase